MYKRRLCAFLALVLGLSAVTGCGGTSTGETTGEGTTIQTECTDAAAGIPADGNPDDVTCKGSYTEQTIKGKTIAATVGQANLTLEQLQVYYWLEVASYRASGGEAGPDFDLPLDSQPCELDDSVNSWQQYFLRRALNTWHSTQALILQSEEVGLPTEEAYQPNLENHAKYLVDIPATRFLYGYQNNYHINTLHQEYLDALPQRLDELAQEKGFSDAEELAQAVAGASEKALLSYAADYNTGYAYYTGLSYYVQTGQEAVEAWFAEHEQEYADRGITQNGEKYVDVRQMLVIPQVPQPEKDPWNPDKETENPYSQETVTVAADGTVSCSEVMWALGEEQARELLAEYEAYFRKNQASASKSTADAVFADFAHSHSDDTDTAPNGGLYYHLRQGQLTQELDSWCFDEARQEGDMTILRTDCGYHILFFKGSVESWYAAAEADLTAHLLEEAVRQARESYPMTVAYDSIALEQVESTAVLTADDLLYADVAHERYPEIPLYLQQDYPNTKYGNYRLSGHGCGITTMAMLATYMADTELTPPMLCDRYGNYCYLSGTDGSLFNVTPSEMGFYLKEKTFDHRVAKAAMEQGHVVVCLQTKGYWTRGGHYLALEKLVDGLEGEEAQRVQVRDSNIFNYGKLKDHKIDAFKWGTIPMDGQAYWVFEYKNVEISICSRCGDPSGTTQTLLAGEYLCEKCQPAILRRDTYLHICGNE